MSCFIVDENSLNALVTALIDNEIIKESDAQEILNEAVKINDIAFYRNINVNQEFFKFKKEYFELSHGGINLNKAQLLTSIRCYNYQAVDCGFYELTSVYKLFNNLEATIRKSYIEEIAFNQYGFYLTEPCKQDDIMEFNNAKARLEKMETYNLPYMDLCDLK